MVTVFYKQSSLWYRESERRERGEEKTGERKFKLKTPETDIDDSIAFVRDLIDKKRKELLKHALIDGFSDLPIASRRLHLTCIKVFQMFYNKYDSNPEMLHQDIQKAIYIPLYVGASKPSMPLPYDSGSKKEFAAINSLLCSSFQISEQENYGIQSVCAHFKA
ncbi:(E,E)-geranyllinalool synthase-like [Durio zibethinus]|uniref:(E,E)-geranyllinalool synthase-like n=1 Tax=Durio zibethinus TaxID=66656 RepID=A0A6P5WGR1_DURZI|nr:(E,E)-geranyllinalool synthase-like [Durio zibethinus]